MSKAHFSAPGCYRIEVEGVLSPDWFDRLGSMRVLAQSQETNSAMTFMQGCVADQAELSGILNTLYELHLSLLSVQFVANETPSQAD